MTNQELWWLTLGIFAAVVVVVAALLGWVIAAARNVDDHAKEIWTTGKQIAGNTTGIWMLEKTNRHLREVQRSAAAIDRALAEMHETLTSGGGRRP